MKTVEEFCFPGIPVYRISHSNYLILSHLVSCLKMFESVRMDSVGMLPTESHLHTDILPLHQLNIPEGQHILLILVRQPFDLVHNLPAQLDPQVSGLHVLALFPVQLGGEVRQITPS